MAKPVPPSTFHQKMHVPESGYRTAIAIKHTGRMTEVSTTFVLRKQDGESAIYAALCPRCSVGEIVVAVKLNPDGTFHEEVACPTLCIGCEDSLDAMLEPGAAKGDGQTHDRATLNECLKAMNVRSWD